MRQPACDGRGKTGGAIKRVPTWGARELPKVPGRPDEAQSYFNQPDCVRAISVGERILLDGQSRREAQRRWTIEATGLRRRFWAITLLWRHAKRDELTPGKILHGLETFAKDKDLPEGLDARDVKHLVAQLISGGRTIVVRDIDDPQGEALLRLFANFSAKQLKLLPDVEHEVVGDKIVQIVKRADLANLGSTYHALIKELPIEAEYIPPPVVEKVPQSVPLVRRRSSHLIPPSIGNYLQPPYGTSDARVEYSNSNEIVNQAYDICEALQGLKKKVVLLYGKPLAGKMAVLVELLRRLSKAGGKTLMLNADGAEGQRISLPVAIFDAQRLNNQALTLEVLTYLTFRADTRMEDVGAASPKVKAQFPGTSDTESTDRMLEQIRGLHVEHPACFIFTGWEDPSTDSTRSFLRGSGRARLITTLTDSNTDSRFLIVSPTELPTLRLHALNFPKFHPEEVKDPAFSEIQRYLPGFKFPQTHEAALQEMKAQLRGRRLSGDILLLMAAALDLCGDAVPGSNGALAQIRVWTEQARMLPLDVNPSATGLIGVVLGELENRGMLRVALVIASSDDGVREDSLRQILNTWHSQSPFLEGFDWDTTLNGLKELRRVGGGFFLTSEKNVSYDDDEFDVGEPNDRDAPNWEFNFRIAEDIRSVIETKPTRELLKLDESVWTMLRHAHRQIAAIARRRAQTKRMRSSIWVRPRGVDHFKRDAQSFTALLASIDPHGINAKHPGPILLRMADDVVFTTTSAFRPDLALRYAVTCILRREIDDKHELTMVYDHDALRLRLYLLIFFPLGHHHIWTSDSLHLPPLRSSSASLDEALTLPLQIPDHLRMCFSPRELMDLITTVAITAFHRQHPDVIVWARDRAEELIKVAERARPGSNRELVDASVRIWCSYYDIAIQLGRPPDTELGKGNHHLSLNSLSNLIKDRYERIDAARKEQDLQKLVKAERTSVQAWMRLKARQAELMSLTTGSPATDDRPMTDASPASDIYNRLRHLEHLVSSADGSEDPVIFSGRTCRRYIRLLARQLTGSTSQTWNADQRGKIATIRSLIETNKSRLRRFGGADQVGVYLDSARLEDLLGEPVSGAKALELARRALNLCDQGYVSHSIRLETLTLLAHLLIESAYGVSSTGAIKMDSRKLAEADLHLKVADRVAVGLQYLPSQASVKLIAARLGIAKFKAKKDLRNLELAEDHIMKAEEILHSCGDLSHTEEIQRLRATIAAAQRVT